MFDTSHPIFQHYQKYPSVCTDTRKIKPGDLFFALHGPNFDGNAYAEKALEEGASAVVVDNPAYFKEKDERYFQVEDTLAALQQLAVLHRNSFDIPVFGITGSNGKTTSKELIYAVLSTKKRVHFTQGNFNNHIGVPLTLLAMPAETEIAVIEMGANQPGDIGELCKIAKPTHGLITNIGAAHLERFINLKGVQKTKGELFDHLRKYKGTAFLNEADPMLKEIGTNFHEVISYGLDSSDFQVQIVQQALDNMELDILQSGRQWIHRVQSNLSGAHNAQNILAAFAVGSYFNIPVSDIQAGIKSYRPTNNRSQLAQVGKFKIWLDAYNANPSSVKASISHIMNAANNDKVGLILGDMLELGETSKEAHRNLGEFIQQYSPEVVIGIGPEMQLMVEAYSGKKAWYSNLNEAIPHIHQDIGDCNLLMLKGSRGMALERLLDSLE